MSIAATAIIVLHRAEVPSDISELVNSKGYQASTFAAGLCGQGQYTRVMVYIA